MTTKTHPTRVLQVLGGLGVGGAETWLMEVLRLWSQTGAGQMDFLITSGEPGIFDDEARLLGAKIFYVRYGRSNIIGFAREFRRILAEGRYDAIHDHADYSSGWHFLLGAGALPPIRVTHVHNPSYQIRNNYGVTLRRRLMSTAGKAMVARYATHIAGTSRQILGEYGFDHRRFRGIPAAALHCGFNPARFIGEGTDTPALVRQELGWPSDAKIILFAGRMDQSPDIGHPQNHKNSAFALEIGLSCARGDPRIRMLFAGALSPALTALQRRIEDAGLSEHVRFAGLRDDIARLMIGSDLLLFPSTGEGLGMVAVEAQAAGLPVLASDSVPRECVVIPDLVRFESLNMPPDSWADLALTMIAGKRDIARANQLVSRSPFALEYSAAQLLRLYGAGTLG